MSKMEFILADTTLLAMEEGLKQVANKAAADKFGTYIVLVPDSKTIMAEHRLLQLMPNGAFANIFVYSLKRLLKKISPIASDMVLSKVAGTMIVRKIILQNKDNLVCFKRAASTAGFAEVVHGTISQLKSSGVGVAEFYEMLQNMPSSSRPKMQDIALLYDQYQQFLEDKYLDESDLLNVLATVATDSDFVKNSNIYFLGYESVTAGYMSVCKTLVSSAKNFTVSASYGVEAANSHIRDNEVYSKFKQLADQLGLYYMPKRIKSKFTPDFEHIKNNLYAYPASQKNGTNCVQLLQAETIADEAEFVAQKISALVRSGVRYKNIAVLAPLEYHKQVSDEFAKWNFTYFVAEPYSFNSHPLFRLVNSALEVARKNFEQSAVIDFASNYFVSPQGDIDDFINYINKYGINYGKFCRKFEKFDENFITNDQFLQIEAKREQIYSLICPFLKNSGTCDEYCNAILHLVNALDITSGLKKLEQEQAADAVEQNITRQAWNKLSLALEQVSRFLGQEKLGIDGLQSVLFAGLDVTDISLIPISQDCINIASNTDGLFDIDYLFIMGAAEGKFPVKQIDCGIITDRDIKELSEKSSSTIEPTIKTINRRERYKAYESLLLASKCVTLSYSTCGGEENLRPSGLVENLISIFGGESGLSIQKYSANISAKSQDYTKQIMQKLCTTDKITEFLCAQIGEYQKYGKFPNPRLVHACKSVLGGSLPPNLQFRLKNINLAPSYTISNANKIYFGGDKTSISQLERWFDCPFVFFTNYGLKLKEAETSTLKALDVGNILHAVAEKFVKLLVKDSFVEPQKAAKNIVDKLLAEQYIAENNKYIVKILKEESIRLCAALKEEFLHSHFKPTGLEQGFGEGKKYPGVALECSNKTITLEGKIDRIDEYDGKFRIIDYKTGKIEDNVKRIYYGKKIQLIGYLLAMQQTGLKPAAVAYYPIRNEFSTEEETSGRMQGFFISDAKTIMDMDTTLSEENLDSSTMQVKLNKPKNGEFNLRKSVNLLSADQFDDAQKYVYMLATQAVNEILSGYIAPSPIRLASNNKLKCENCPYLGVCGVQNTAYRFGRKCYGAVKIENISAVVKLSNKAKQEGGKNE